MRRRRYRRPSDNNSKHLIILIALLLVGIGITSLVLWRSRRPADDAAATVADTLVVKDTLYKYGLPIEEYHVVHDTIQPRQTLAEVLMSYGLSAQKVFSLTQCPDSVFDVRKVRAGQACALLCTKDSTATPCYFVYEVNAKEYALFDLATDSITRLSVPKVTAANVSKGIKVSWGKVTGASKYNVYRKTGSGSWSKIKTTTSTSYTDSSAKAGTTYYYKVKAVAEKSSANSADSKVVSAAAKLAQPEVKVALSSGKPKISWGKVSSAQKYNVYRATSENGEYKKIKTTISTSYTDKDAKSGKTYYYKVQAVCSKSAGNSAYSAVKKIKVK